MFDGSFNNILLINYFGSFNDIYFGELYNNEVQMNRDDLALKDDAFNLNIHFYNFKFNNFERYIYGYNKNDQTLKRIDELANSLDESTIGYINKIHHAFYSYN